VAFSPDSRRLAANCWDNTVTVWSAADATGGPPAAERRAAPWHLAQALAALEAGEGEAAMFHAGPVQDWDAPGPWALERGHLHARLGQWDAAAADFARGFARRPPDSPWLWQEYAQALIRTGDPAGYGALCRQMLAAYGPDRPYDTLRAVAFTCGLAPGAVADYAQPIRLAVPELNKIPHSAPARAALGLLWYRAGQFREAIECCRKIAGAPTEEAVRTVGETIRALAHQRLGEVDEARTCLAAAGRRAAAAGAQERTPAAEWYYWSLYRLLLREADAALAD
jgi:tetratricopeptide (TPR) repeat protein